MWLIDIFSVSLTSVEFSFESNISIGITNTNMLHNNISKHPSMYFSLPSTWHSILFFRLYLIFREDSVRKIHDSFIIFTTILGGAHIGHKYKIFWDSETFSELNRQNLMVTHSSSIKVSSCKLCFFRLFLLDAMIESVIGGIIILLAPAPIKDPFSHLSLCQK